MEGFNLQNAEKEIPPGKTGHLFTKTGKTRREQSPGFEYREVNEIEVLNVLFVCTMNKWRSRTAEKIYADHPHLQVRSAGTSSKARHRLTVADIRWADQIIVMEEKHRERIQSEFRKEVRFSEMHVVDVEDRFEFMDPRLVDELREVIDPILVAD